MGWLKVTGNRTAATARQNDDDDDDDREDTLLLHLKEIPGKLQLDLDEEDVVRGMGITPLPDLFKAHRQAVARRHRVQHGKMEHEPPTWATGRETTGRGDGGFKIEKNKQGEEIRRDATIRDKRRGGKGRRKGLDDMLEIPFQRRSAGGRAWI